MLFGVIAVQAPMAASGADEAVSGKPAGEAAAVPELVAGLGAADAMV